MNQNMECEYITSLLIQLDFKQELCRRDFSFLCKLICRKILPSTLIFLLKKMYLIL